MWSVFFLFLSYLDGDFVKGELLSLDAEKESRVSYLLLSSTARADTSACHADHVTPKSARQETPHTDHLHSVRRSKRGFTYPGTLWCGAGNIADHYHQLGEFAETDKCCRTHDHCPHVIHPFSTKYGFTNFKWLSISHCDCDNVMKECLKMVNDTSSRVVGQAFFNVIEVPCFEFSIEEQCVERHWYGVCKRYEKVPVAVIRESVPYDFGGIEVIDVLTVAPPKTKLFEIDEGKQKEMQKSESTTQSSVSGSKNHAPEEPSLTNVVTAAEDFIKLLATVSTSQSSSTDSGNTGETQASDKKRKKTRGKKRKDSKKRRGKGKKRKQNTDRVSKANGSVTRVPSANRAEDAINKNKFVEDSGTFDWGRKNVNFMNSQFNSVGDTEHANKMMRDEHQKTPDKSQVTTTTALYAKQEPKMLEPQKQIKDMEFVQLFSTPFAITKTTTAILKQRVVKKSQGHPTPTFLPVKGSLHNTIADNTAMSTTESTSLAGLTTPTSISLQGEEAPHNFGSQHEKGSAFNATTQNTPIVGTKRLRLRQKGGRRKSRKLYNPFSPTNALPTEEPKVLLTDTTWVVGPFPEPQSASETLQTNGTKNILKKTTTGVSGEIQLKALKDTVVRKRAQKTKSNSSTMGDVTKPSTSINSALTELATQTKDVEASTVQPCSYRLQTITPSIIPLKTRTSKRRRSKERYTKTRREKQATDIGG